MPDPGQVFTIIDNRFAGPVVGYFAASNYPEGALVTPLDGGDVRFRISYTGGDGNDVTLTVVPEPGALSIAGGCWLALCGRRRRATRG
jgi:hypothetical protein